MTTFDCDAAARAVCAVAGVTPARHAVTTFDCAVTTFDGVTPARHAVTTFDCAVTTFDCDAAARAVCAVAGVTPAGKPGAGHAIVSRTERAIGVSPCRAPRMAQA